MKKLFVVFLLLPYFIQAQNGNNNPDITSEEIQQHINYLASDKLEGRFTGSEGEKLAGEYIAKEFKTYGLKPLFNGDYFQSFPFIEKVELTDNNSMTLKMGDKEVKLEVKKDFITAPFSGTTNIAGELVFAGYGISAPMFGYDDYKDIDVKGKFVLVMRNHPEYDSTESKFDRFATLRSKAANAKDKGAAGIIFVNEHVFTPKSDDFISLKYDGAPAVKDFAVMQISKNYADKLFNSIGKDFKTVQEDINKSLSPDSFLFNNVKVNASTEVKEIEKMGHNVAAYIEGTDPLLKDQYIVVGGHYDHLGYGQTGSRYTGSPMPIHNGADDNASGTSGVLEIAEKMAAMKDKLKRTIVFITFSGEELGLLGSNYFVNNSPFPIEKTIAMLNMDMIGRMVDDKLTVIGSGTSDLWKELLEKDNTYGFQLALNDDGWGGSDHTSFTTKDIPVLFFFTGIHMDYHMPSDDADLINSKGEENVVNYVADILADIEKREKKPDFVKVKPQSRPEMRGRSKVKVGTVPEFGYNGEGYKISGVTEGSAAEKAGLKGGDIIIMFNDKEVGNIYDFMNAMTGLMEGDSVNCKVKRGEEELDFKLEL